MVMSMGPVVVVVDEVDVGAVGSTVGTVVVVVVVSKPGMVVATTTVGGTVTVTVAYPGLAGWVSSDRKEHQRRTKGDHRDDGAHSFQCVTHAGIVAPMPQSGTAVQQARPGPPSWRAREKWVRSKIIRWLLQPY